MYICAVMGGGGVGCCFWLRGLGVDVGSGMRSVGGSVCFYHCVWHREWQVLLGKNVVVGDGL